MRILLIPDKFKGSLTAQEVVEAINRGVRSVHPSVHIDAILASDGGEGFLDAITKYKEVERIDTATTDPLGRFMQAYYLWQEPGKTAYVEMAMASGLELLEESDRNPSLTTTWGTGLQIKDAIGRGAQTLYLGIGGSATNDGGIGVAAALGYQFLDEGGNEVQLNGSGLRHIHRIIKPKASYNGITFIAVNDVNNPLYGENGAAYVYGPQKGADPEIVSALDSGLRHLDKIVKRDLERDSAHIPGAGAAGGLAYGLSVFFDAKFIGGIDFILGLAGLEDRLVYDPPELIITGEGRIDTQSLSGKLIQGVLDRGRVHRIPVLAVCGMLDITEERLVSEGFLGVLEIRDPMKPLTYNMKNASELLETAIRDYFESAD